MDKMEMVIESLRLNRELLDKSPETRVWPCLYGNSGSGKTSRARELASKLGLEFVPIILSHTLPEDIGGIPRVVRGRVEWILPSWCDKPCLVFFDEIDKAPRDCIAAILSILTSHTLRGKRLHPDTVFLFAMQPPEWDDSETIVALKARMFPVICEEKESYIKAGLPVPHWADSRKVEWPYLEVPTNRQVFYLLEARKRSNTLYNSLLEVMFNDTVRVHVKAWVEGLGEVSEKNYYLTFRNNVELVDNLSIPEVVKLYGITPKYAEGKDDLPLYSKLLERITAEAGPDEVQKAVEGFYDSVEKLERDGRAIIFGDVDEDTFAMVTYNAVKSGMDKRKAKK